MQVWDYFDCAFGKHALYVVASFTCRLIERTAIRAMIWRQGLGKISHSSLISQFFAFRTDPLN
jgi:hypothetical protein